MSKISIVVPVYNEEEAVPIFYDEATKVMNRLDESYEIVFVNDGSGDRTVDIVKDIAKKDERIKLVSFSRNFGQMAAIFAGLENATGDAVIVMDVDLQDPVEVIPSMVEKWKQGWDVVHGRRSVRKGVSLLKKITSKIWMKFINKISKLNIPQNVGEFKLMDRKVVDVLVSLPEHDRYLRGTVAWAGFKQTFVEFERKERVAGDTKYSLKKMIKLAGKSTINLSTWPLSFSMKFGVFTLALSLICFVTFIVLCCCKIFLPLTAWLFPTIVLMFSILFIFNGFTNIYLNKVYQECQNRPRYVVAEKVNIDNDI